MTRILPVIALLLGAAQAAAPWQPLFERVQPDLFAAPGGQASAWADVDGDGDPDYFVAFRGRPNRLYRNDHGTFREVAAEVGLADNQETRAAAWGDFDADGDPDLFIGFADPKVPAKVYRNDQKGSRFTNVAGAIGVSLRGVARQPAWVDYDRDGDLDLFVANYGASALYRNEAGQSFAEVSNASGINLTGHGVTSAWGDLDNDGWPDLYVGNFIAGQPLYRDALFMNRGASGAARSFVESLPDVILKHDATHGVQLVDFDGDGRIDLSLTNNDPDGGGHPLLRNIAPTRGRGFFVEVTDDRGRQTLAGSEVRVFQPRTRQLLAATLVDGGSGYCSQNAMPVHLGVPDAWKGRVDVEVTVILRGQRRVRSVKGVDPGAHVRRPLRVSLGDGSPSCAVHRSPWLL